MKDAALGGVRRNLVIGLAAVALWGCGDDGTLPPAEVRGTIEVANGTPDLHVFMLFFRSCGTTSWGLDRLPNTPCTDDGCIPPNESREFIVEAGCYDLKADLADLATQEVVGSDSILDFVLLANDTQRWTVRNLNPPGPQ